MRPVCRPTLARAQHYWIALRSLSQVQHSRRRRIHMLDVEFERALYFYGKPYRLNVHAPNKRRRSVRASERMRKRNCACVKLSHSPCRAPCASENKRVPGFYTKHCPVLAPAFFLRRLLASIRIRVTRHGGALRPSERAPSDRTTGSVTATPDLLIADPITDTQS
jgi:hypothetical protein